MKHIDTVGLVALAAGLTLFPLVVPNPYYIHLMVVIAIFTILLFGLDIVVGYTGEVSLGHAGLFGIGAYGAGVAAVKFGLPFYAAVPFAIGVTGLFGALLAIPALRVTGPYLAMVTLAFGTIAQILINEMDFITNGPQGLVVVKPILLGHKLKATEFYYLAFAFAFGSLFIVNRLLKSHIGRAFEALRGSPLASDCMGVSVYRYKVLAFVISACFAGLAGALFAYSEEYIAPNTFNFELTILFLLAVTLGGCKNRLGAVLGAAIVVLLPNLLSDVKLFRGLTVFIALIVGGCAAYSLIYTKTTFRKIGPPLMAVAAFTIFAFVLEDIIEHRLTIFGLMILAVVYYLPDGIMGFLKELTKKRWPWLTSADLHPVTGEGLDGFLVGPGSIPLSSGPLIAADSVLMQFGGLKALNNVSLSVSQGTVHGLIGPNGSGKTTLMNVLTGIYRPTGGRVEFKGGQIQGMTPSAIAKKGIARTFQNVQLFGQMTAVENVMVGLHYRMRSNVLDAVLRTPRYRRENATAVKEALALLHFVGLLDVANEEARNLPYGKQRLLEIARALALKPLVLLLDEPAAGVPPQELDGLKAMIRKIKEAGVTVILIEHHMDVVMGVSDRVSVLDFGQKISEGTPTEVQRDQKVVAAYLGSTTKNVQQHCPRPVLAAV